MKKFLVDTDVLVDFFHDQKYAQKLISEISSESAIVISIITVTELLSGFSSKQTQYFLPKLYDMSQVYNLSLDIAELAGKWRFEYAKKGKILSTADTLIAATAITNNLHLVTRNKKDYPMPDLKFYPI